MKPSIGVVLLALSLGTTCCSQDSAKKSLPPECVKTIPIRDSFPKGLFKTPPGESYKRSPAVKFLIHEDGTVSDTTIVRSSGVADIDQRILDAIAKWKYKPRPSGCGVIENQVTLTIHLGESH
jgi:TonB family protein